MIEMESMTRSLWAGIRIQQYQPDESLWALTVPYPTFEQTLKGISVALKASEADTIVLLAFAIRRALGESGNNHSDAESEPPPIRLSQVSTQHQTQFPQSDDPELHSLTALAFVICALRESAHHRVSENRGCTGWTSFLWAEICCALETLHSSTRYRVTVTRSAQGFLAVPLCSLISKDGNIEELFRIHVWLPDGERGNPDLAVHSHQAFAHSWILAGQATDCAYDGRRAAYEEATHAEYSLAWNGGNGCSTAYKTHQTSSTVVNAGRYVKVDLKATRKHSAGMYYTIPHATFHTTEVEPNGLHATLFFFDASQGFQRDAPVLGPWQGVAYTHVREDPGVTATDLIRLVDLARQWETCVARGTKGRGWEAV